jgi:hypothetical protein
MLRNAPGAGADVCLGFYGRGSKNVDFVILEKQ